MRGLRPVEPTRNRSASLRYYLPGAFAGVGDVDGEGENRRKRLVSGYPQGETGCGAEKARKVRPLIYITIPVHNEESTIGVLLWKIRNTLGEFGRDYELLVLDDASTDGTGEVLRRYRRTLPLRVFRSEERLGYAGALERLIREAVERAPYPKRDAIVTLQGDFTEHPEYLVPLVKTLEGGADVVAGRLTEVDGGAPLSIRFARWAAPRVLGQGLKACPVTDPVCGFRIYRVIVLKKALRDLGDQALIQRPGWAANVELLELAVHQARRVEEIPLGLRYDIRTRRSRFRTFQTLRELSRIRGKMDWAQEEGAAGGRPSPRSWLSQFWGAFPRISRFRPRSRSCPPGFRLA
jgi:glycosyltransferase involved in cell wall biosynthesis